MENKVTAKEQAVLDFINIIQPEHSRSSCNDKELGNGFYSSTEHTRCLRCTLLQIVREGRLPQSHTLRSDFMIDPKLAKTEMKERYYND